MTAELEAPLAHEPLVPTLTSTVLPLPRSRRKMSLALLVSPGSKSSAQLTNSAYRPSAERPAGIESPSPPFVPMKFTLTKMVVPLVRSRRYTLRRWKPEGTMGALLLVSTRLPPVLAKSTNLPSALRQGFEESPPPARLGEAEASKAEIVCNGSAAALHTARALSADQTALRYLENGVCISGFPSGRCRRRDSTKSGS